jgi:tetratricopeptide (TPR) repeat protein
MNNRRNSLVSATLLIFLALAVSGQTTPADRAALDGFRKGIDAGRLAEVERDLMNYVIARPKDAAGFALLAKLRLRQGRLEEARALSGRALSVDPELIAAKIVAAAVARAAGDPVRAAELLRPLTDKAADDPTRLEIAEGLAGSGDCVTALALVAKTGLRFRNTAALPVRANCAYSAGDKAALAGLLPVAKAAVPSGKRPPIAVAGVFSSAGMLRESAELLRSVSAADPKDPEPLLLLARAEVAAGDLVRAKATQARAAKLVPDSAEVFFVGSMIESAAKNNQKAYELLGEALARDPRNVEYLARFVVVAMRADQAGRGVRAAEVLLSMQPDNPDFLYLHGASALQANSTAKAEASLEKFASLRPNDSRGCLALGLAYAAQPDKLDAARNKMESCLVIDPSNFEAAYQLGLFYKSQGDSAKAVEYFERTTAIAPAYPAALRDLGAALIQTGNEAKARIALEKAVKLDPNDAEVHFQLSRLYNIIGERELAKKHFEMFQKLRNPKKDGM